MFFSNHRIIKKNKIMTSEQIQAIGIFLQYYETDLLYIKEFQKVKNQEKYFKHYLSKENSSFYSFLIEFRIIRNISSGASNQLLDEILKWIKDDNYNDVDAFAEHLSNTEITRNQKLVSLASKVLFLNNPWEILPMDRLTRKTLNQNDNNYSIYKKGLEVFKKENEKQIKECLKFVEPITFEIHKDFFGIKELNLICENRIVDKLLWTKGRK
jgi:hypothetical protein